MAPLRAVALFNSSYPAMVPTARIRSSVAVCCTPLPTRMPLGYELGCFGSGNKEHVALVL